MQEEQLLKQSVEIDELYSLIDRYENIVEKDKSRGRSKCEFANLVRELNEAIDRFHRSSEEVEKIDDLVKGIKRELDVKKEQVIQ